VTQVVSFPVEGRDIQTGALDVVDDKLCLLLVEDGTLWLRVYLRDGTLQHETALMQISPDSDTQYYMLYANKSDGSTMLCYHLCNVTTADMKTEEQMLLCVELGEKATLRSVITPRDGVLRAAFIGGRWVVVEYNTTVTVNWPTSAPVYHYVSVLDDAGQTLYRGEIVTDAAEDVRQYYEIIGWEGTVEWYQEPYITDRYGYGADYTLTRGLYCDEISEG
jgi:hypothetical protein